MKKFIICIFLLLGILLQPVNADYKVDTDSVENALDREFKEYIGNQDIENIDIDKGISSISYNFINIFKVKIKGAFAASLGIILCCVISSLINNFSLVSESKIGVKVTNYTCSFLIVTISIFSDGGIISKCSEAIVNIDRFSKILTPVFAISTAVAKHPLTAVSVASVSLIFMNIFTTIVLNIILPAIYMFAVLYVVGTMTDTPILYKLCDLVKWGITMFYKIIVMVFVGYISLSGIISSAGDVAAIKTTKTVISNSVPIVGSIISDASDAILSGANILKTSIGVYGVLGVCALCLVPFIGSLANYLVFKVTSAISASLCNLSAIKAVDGIATAYGLALASLATCCALQFITIVVTSVVTYL